MLHMNPFPQRQITERGINSPRYKLRKSLGIAPRKALEEINPQARKEEPADFANLSISFS
jgi:hypothetical protein